MPSDPYGMGTTNGEILDRIAQSERHSGKAFIRDGVIDPQRWEKAPAKVLFLLKEARDDRKGSEGYDLCELIRKTWGSPKTPMWHNVARWAHMIQAWQPGSAVPRLPDDSQSDVLPEALLSSAVVDIKKSSGRNRSEDEDLRIYMKEDGSEILQQIKTAQPDIVVCGNTWGIFRDWLEEHDEAKKNAWTQLGDIVFEHAGIPFVDFWHPAHQIHRKLLYYALGGALSEANFGITASVKRAA